MPPRPSPTEDLARMYRERIPTAPKSIGRLGPVSIGGGGLSLNPMPALRSAGGFFKRAVESLDPRLLAEQGGRSVEHVYGDARELAKSVVTGEDTLSQSPSARAYQAAGGGLAGTLNATFPYVDVATAIVPTTKVFTPSGRVALAADAAERVASRQLGQAISQATPTVRQATADATERLAQSMATPTLADRPTIYMNNYIYDPTPPAPAPASIGINEIDDILRDIQASRPEAPPTQLAGAVERTNSNLPRGVYAVDSPSGNVTLYQLDDDGIVKGKLIMNRGNYGYVVSSLSADPGSVAAANLLAAAKITGDLNFPGVQYPLTPSTNLSQFSRPLVQKLQAAGLVDPNYNLPEPKLLNTIDRPFEIEYPIPVQEIPRLVGVPPQQLRDTTRELIQALAKAKREGRISPDTIERTAQLRAELAARQARIASQQGQIRNTFTQSISPPTATTPERAIEVLGPEGPNVLRQLSEQDRSQIIADFMAYSSPEEFLLRPLEELSAPDLSDVAKIQKIDDLTLTLAQRLQINDPISYRFDDPEEFNVFTENIQFDLANTWRRYGGERGRQLAELIDPDGG